MRITEAFSQRFWANVEKSDGCWNWTKSTRYGYGQVWDGTNNHVAHRVGWTLTHGPIEHGLFLCHHCDNRRCVRPDHMFLGTQSDNLRDMRAKGRDYKFKPKSGSKNPNSKLSEADIRAIRSRYPKESLRALARAFQVEHPTIASIVKLKTWAHIK